MDEELKKLYSLDNTADILKDAEQIVESSRKIAFHYVNSALIMCNWLLGKRIDEEILANENKDNYGKQLIKKLSKELTAKYGKGFQMTVLYYCVRFYKLYPKILNTLCEKSFSLLSWSHYRLLLHVVDDNARRWYEKEATEQTWAVRTLQRNIDSQYYYSLR